MPVIRIIAIQFHRVKRENTVLTVIVHAMEKKIYLLTYLRERIPWGNFRGNRSSWASFFMFFAYFVYIAHLTKFTRGNSLLMEKSKAEESPW